MPDGPADNTLYRLVSELSLSERIELLEKIRAHSTLSYEPLYFEEEYDTEKAEMAEAQYSRLSWFKRLRYFLLSFFKGKSPVKVFEAVLVNRLGKKIAAEAPGLYDCQKNLLLLGFADQLLIFRDAVRFFHNVLDFSVYRDKGGFYIFLGSLEMGDVHRRLETETIPELFTEGPDTAERQLRQASLKAMEDIFSALPEGPRDSMYSDARSLNCLKELASFGFDHIIMTFDSTGWGQTCPPSAIRDMLLNLNNILFSLKEPPDLALLESLFVYRLQERSGEPGFEADSELQSLLNKAAGAIEAIREFNRRVPLTKIIRCIDRDLAYAPQEISGGEDWLTIYKEQWKLRVDDKVTEYTRKRKYDALLNSFQIFLKGAELRPLENVVSSANPDGLPVKESFALSFLLTFHSAVFSSELNVFLRPILIEGEFFKKENRTEYTAAYNDIVKIEDSIKIFDSKIAPSGEFGRLYKQTQEELSALAAKRRKTQQVLEEISKDANAIILHTRYALFSLVNILGGILKKEAGGKYDTLTNLEKLGGKNPEQFIEGIRETIRHLQQTLQILKDIEDLGNAPSVSNTSP